MERSASAPTLTQEDYHLPCHGVGCTGPPPRVLYCFTSKDTGKTSSRIASIIRQAGKVPGPGQYVAHTEWKLGQSTKFLRGSRDYKPMHKGPAGGHYEAKDDFALLPSVGARENTSNHGRTLYGKVTPGKRRSFLDSAVRQGGASPGPIYNPAPGCSDRLPIKMAKTVPWDKEKNKAKSLKVKIEEIGPDRYNLDFSRTESRAPNWTVPKEAGKNFIDKCVREKLLDTKSKKPLPGPDSSEMQNFNLDNISRGTYHCQLRNLTRSASTGYF